MNTLIITHTDGYRAEIAPAPDGRELVTVTWPGAVDELAGLD